MRSHLGFTGTQDISGISEERKRKLDDELDNLCYESNYFYFHHGDCIGADELAHEFASDIGYNVIIHPPEDKSKRAFCSHDYNDIKILRPKAYLVRNIDIVNASNLLLAFPKDPNKEELRSGTWATIRYARSINKPVIIV